MKYCRWIKGKNRGENVKLFFTREESSDTEKKLGIKFDKEKFDLEEFYIGMNVELEHVTRFPVANVTNNDPILTGMIALAHLLEFPDYYTRLLKLEDEAKKYWSSKNLKIH